jgi:hypothetical protein
MWPFTETGTTKVSTLDSILSGQGEAVSEQPAIVEQAVTQEAEGQEQTGGEGEQQGQKMVPHEALHAEKQKVKRYTDEVTEFRRSNEALQRQVSELLQRVPVPKQEQPPAPDFYDSPAEATRHAVAPQFEQFNQTLLANAQLIAGIKYGDDKVSEAEEAFIQAVQAKSLDPADYQKVVNSPNRYAAAVQWHQRQQAQAEIGPDPVAYRAKIEAEILAKHGITAGEQPAAVTQQAPAAVMPSNLATARNVGARSGPTWSGPTPLGDIFKR